MNETQRPRSEEDFAMPDFETSPGCGEVSPLTPEELQEAIRLYRTYCRMQTQPHVSPFGPDENKDEPHADRHSRQPDNTEKDDGSAEDDGWEEHFRRGDTVPFAPFGRRKEHPPFWDCRRTTNRYTIRADGFPVPDISQRLQQLACGIWAAGIILTLMTALLGGGRIAEDLLSCLWILAGAGAYGAFVYCLIWPVKHLAQIAGALQHMDVEQTEFAEEE